MGQPTTLEVFTGSAEYSRYERGRDTVRVTLQASGGDPYSHEPILLDLVKARRSRDSVVGSQSLYLDGPGPIVTSAEFKLADLVDHDLINLVRHGKYFIRATSPATAAECEVVGAFGMGSVFISPVTTGDDTNYWLLDIIAPSGTEGLSVQVSGNQVTISLAVAGGIPIPSANTVGQIAAVVNATMSNVLVARTWGDPTATVTAPASGLTFSGGRDAVVGESPEFDVRVVTVDRLKTEYLFGIPLQAGKARFVRFQPTNITGVEVVEVSTNHSMGMFPLNYTYLDTGTDVIRQLSWAGGNIVNVTKPGQYILRKGNAGSGGSGSCGGASGMLASLMASNDYIIVQVQGPTFMPTANAMDELLIDQLRLDDTALMRYLCQAEDWLENVILATYVEPTHVTTDRDPTIVQFAAGINAPVPLFIDADYDFLVGPLTYFPPRTGNDWVDIQTPYPQILRVDNLFGSIANTRVIDIDLDWIHAYPQGGFIQLVPFNQTVAFDFMGLIWVNALRGAAAIPNFWHFNMVVGLRDCPCDLQEVIAKKAAMDALVMLGNALRPGIGSTSLGRDGVSQSVSYNTQMQYGPYTGAIMAFKDWFSDNLPKIQGKYRGATLTVV